MLRDRGTERTKEKPHLEENGLVLGGNPKEKIKQRGERQSERETERVELMKAQGKDKKTKYNE